MDSLQSLPSRIDPIALMIGSFPVRWYAVCFLLGLATAWLSVRPSAGRPSDPRSDVVWLSDFMPLLFLSVLSGGRLGYALLYEPALFLHPLSIVSPFDPVSGAYTGIRGMSFFGALFGATAVSALFAMRRGIRFLDLVDTVVPGVPIALFFGRIGNFLNGELYGRVTDVPWGMYFPLAPDGGTLLRHPSQLYEAVLEGLLLFVILSGIGRRPGKRGTRTAVFLISYGVVRFLVEYFRFPDSGRTDFSGFMTTGQVLSLILIFFTSLVAVFLRRRTA